MSGTIADTPPSRPSFTNGQYIGADDLNAAVNYARDETRRLSLSGRTWGIAGGLALVEIPDATGAIQMWIEPGMAWDGYGRPIVLASPVPVTADLFAGLAGGLQVVWLYYRSLKYSSRSSRDPDLRCRRSGDAHDRNVRHIGRQPECAATHRRRHHQRRHDHRPT